MVVSHLRSPDMLEQTLIDLGSRHVRYGAAPEYYRAVVTTLVDVLAETAGSAWTEELQNAWTEGLNAVAATMLRGAPELRLAG